MNRHRRETLALRREALVARAALQRVEFVTAVDRVRRRARTSRGIGPLALRVVRSLAAGHGGAASPSPARPLALSAGWLLVRALRTSPTVRWVVGAAAIGGAVWWVARSLRADRGRSGDGDDPSDDGGGPDADDTGTEEAYRREAPRTEGRATDDDASG